MTEYSCLMVELGNYSYIAGIVALFLFSVMIYIETDLGSLSKNHPFSACRIHFCLLKESLMFSRLNQYC